VPSQPAAHLRFMRKDVSGYPMNSSRIVQYSHSPRFYGLLR
jgi:hypothetical protein